MTYTELFNYHAQEWLTITPLKMDIEPLVFTIQDMHDELTYELTRPRSAPHQQINSRHYVSYDLKPSPTNKLPLCL